MRVEGNPEFPIVLKAWRFFGHDDTKRVGRSLS